MTTCSGTPTLVENPGTHYRITTGHSSFSLMIGHTCNRDGPEPSTHELSLVRNVLRNFPFWISVQRWEEILAVMGKRRKSKVRQRGIVKDRPLSGSVRYSSSNVIHKRSARGKHVGQICHVSDFRVKYIRPQQDERRTSIYSFFRESRCVHPWLISVRNIARVTAEQPLSSFTITAKKINVNDLLPYPAYCRIYY